MTNKKRIIIIGGVAGGASTAARARRLNEDTEIILIERGEHISFANCGLPYHIGGEITDRSRLLVQTPESMRQRFNIDVRTQCEAISIDRSAKQVTLRDLVKKTEYTESYDTLVLSPGAEPIKPPMTGIDSKAVFTLRNIPDMDAIKKEVDAKNCKHAVVVGGGYIGLEMAEALNHRNVKVSLIELAPQVMGTVDPEIAQPLHHELKAHGIDLHLNISLDAVIDNNDSVTVQLSDGQKITTDMVVMAIGVKPEVKLAKEANLTLGPRGGIAVNDQMQTSDENIYAVGDAIEVVDFVSGTPALIPLAGPANRQGRIAADNIFGQKSSYHKTQGTAICKVFDLSVACTGLNEKMLKRLNIPHEKIYVHPANHASYYPGASQMTVKLLFDPKDGKILGAQAVGTKGIDKRIDVLAVAIRAGLTVFDLQDLELCYAPPYGSAKDPVNYAGFIAANVIKGDTNICHVEDVINPKDNQLLLDVRTEAEVSTGTIPGSKHIPVDDLRSKLSNLPRDKEILVFCQVGLRGYIACRILQQNGFNTKNLTGGYKTYKAFISDDSELLEYNKELTDDTGEKDAMNTPATFDTENITTIDACGLQCPGPIMQLKTAMDTKQPGQVIKISSTDHGFVADIKGWCNSTGNTLIDTTKADGIYTITIGKGQGVPKTSSNNNDGKTIVVFNCDFDKAMAAFIIANGAASMGKDVTLFFTFWGLNLLRKSESVSVKKTFIERMFGFMMPQGPNKVKLSKMNMAGMGTAMIKGIMKNKNVLSLPELIENAKANGIRLVACTMTMDLMGIKKEELIDGVEEGGVAMYLDQAESANVNLFI
ncbi:MAG: FAD-dependent oxidoreductase [Phycisphaerae bacterium]|nr:FAD-dependent oxidoreductase [Phycisphaerae bacterium]